MLRYMLDTDICIRVLRERPAGARLRFNQEAEALCISVVTLGELLYRAERSARPLHHRQQVEYIADIRARLERQGSMIGPYDLMIAGHARSRGLIGVSGNLREFSRVDGLRAEDWLALP